jgi:hypothetical protein
VRAGVPALEALAVPDAVFRLATRVDFAGLWRARESWLAAFHDLDVAELHARMTRANGLAVAEDLLVHLGDETLLVWLETERDARPDILPGLPCGLVRVREEVPFRGAVKKLARRDPRSSILADDEDRLVATFDDFCIGVGGGYACLAYGADAAEEVEDLVSLANAVKPVGAARPAPVPHAPPGLCGRGAIEIADVAATYSLPLAGMLQFLFGPGLPLPIAADVQREVERRMPLLRSHGLTAATILVGAQPSEWRLRILW